MLNIPTSRLPEKTIEGLRKFVEICRERAVEKGCIQYGSISLRVPHLSPLAVLQTVYDPSERHAYFENPGKAEAVAAAEAVAKLEVKGRRGFEAVRRFTEEVLEHTIAAGDLSEGWSGPCFFCQFNFNEEESGEAYNGFPGACVFLPRWQVARKGEYYTAVANFALSPEDDADEVIKGIWETYRKFSDFSYDAASELDVVSELDIKPMPKLRPLSDSLRRAIDAVEGESFDKLVIAHAEDYELGGGFDILALLHRLRERFYESTSFSWGDAAAGAFLGAAPERLARVSGGRLETEALAGTAPRGKDAREDAQLARSLLESRKNNSEHGFVADYLIGRLQEIGLDPISGGSPRLRTLPNVQHLLTPIEAIVPDGIHLLDVATKIHPTPAVCGSPKEKAREWLDANEAFARGPYGGCIGFYNAAGEGELIVGIRSALIQRGRMRLFAGAGIVEGSDPEEEENEIRLKLEALLKSTGGNE